MGFLISYQKTTFLFFSYENCRMSNFITAQQLSISTGCLDILDCCIKVYNSLRHQAQCCKTHSIFTSSSSQWRRTFWPFKMKVPVHHLKPFQINICRDSYQQGSCMIFRKLAPLYGRSHAALTKLSYSRIWPSCNYLNWNDDTLF